MRARYEYDIAQAETALAIAVAAREPADLADPDSPLAVLSGKLSVYTGLVETARANNRQGLPVGAAYQREASNLMRDGAAAGRATSSTTHETAGRRDDQDGAAVVPGRRGRCSGWSRSSLLFFAQRYVRQRTRRRLNVGLARRHRRRARLAGVGAGRDASG